MCLLRYVRFRLQRDVIDAGYLTPNCIYLLIDGGGGWEWMLHRAETISLCT
jgi:hypothetical protein